MVPIKLLLVEDDESIAAGLEYFLSQEGFKVTACYNAPSALDKIASEGFDFAIIDISLPGGNGFDVCRKLKEKGDTPVIFLTARDDEGSVVMGLDIGADDYIVKPFRLRELHSRVRAILRRAGKGNEDHIVNIGSLTVNLAEGKVKKNGKEVFLTALEYRLLLTMVSNRGQVLTREQLLQGIWDAYGDFVNDNTLTVYIKRLREKIEDDPRNPTIIKTARGIGYWI